MSLPPEPKRTVLEDELSRHKQDREQSDSRYDEALTALDAALWQPPAFPHPPPSLDETQITPLNTRWDILRARPAAAAGWRARLARAVCEIVEPVFAEQQAFNSALVDHLNRNIHPQRETAKSIASTISTLQQQVERLCAFHSVLMQYLQRITPFVNSKDYEFDTLGRRIMLTFTYAISGLLLAATGYLFAVDAVTPDQLTIAWMIIFFFASAAASAAYLTVSETFPLEMRALAIAFFYAIGTGVGGVLGPWLLGALIDTGSRYSVFAGYLLGALLMITAAGIAWRWCIAAERKPLEEVAPPLASAG